MGVTLALGKKERETKITAEWEKKKKNVEHARVSLISPPPLPQITGKKMERYKKKKKKEGKDILPDVHAHNQSP